MAAKNDLAGNRFGRLIAIEMLNKSTYQGRIWFCQCDCGNTHLVSRAMLVSGKVRSCGCLLREHAVSLSRTHGLSHTPEWMAWHTMRDRCNNPNNQAYESYGGRGITVCPQWQDSFETFYCDMGSRPEKMSLDRINNNLGYSPQNCRWVDRSTQQHNQRISSRNTSGIRGVSNLQTGKYLAQLMVNNKLVLNRTFDSFDEAVSERKRAELLHLKRRV